jgi:trehalose/maltose hydrolase-like predicted phosphorylase
MSSAPLAEHRYRLIAFDWDGTAVTDRSEHPAELARAMGRILESGVTLAVITGTNAGNVSGQIAPLLSVNALGRLYLMVNRGSEVYAYDATGELELLWRRDASDAENRALDETTAAVRAELAERHGVSTGLVSNRLNRRKIDLIPEPEWADPPKARIGELLQAVDRRLSSLPGGIGAVIDLSARMAAEHGLADARITSDVKHVEIGLTDKSDSIAFLMRRLAPMRGIRPQEILIAGDEFGPISGVEGSDYRMVTRLAEGATLVSVGKEPNGVPEGVAHLGGGPEEFVRILDRQAELPAVREAAPAPPVPAAAEDTRGEGWLVTAAGYHPDGDPSFETLFGQANGYMGVRGSADEPHPAATPGAYLAGLYDGQAAGVEDMAVIPDWTTTDIEIAGRPFEPWRWTVLSQQRTLDLAALAFRRELLVEDPDGRRIGLTSLRLLSLDEPHTAGIRLVLTIEDGPPAGVELVAGVRTRGAAGALPHCQAVAAGHREGTDLLHARTPGARVAVDVAQAVTAGSGDGSLAGDHVADEDFSGRRFQTTLEAGGSVILERFVAVYSEREQELPARAAAEAAERARRGGWHAFESAHRAAWSHAWARADVEITGDADAQLGLRFAVAQLIAHSPLPGSRASIGAKGLTGEGYKGHVFWDTDMFLMPFYSLTMPEVARRIIEYRLGTLPAARRHAADHHLDGAWFAWESAATGDDVTPDHVVGPDGRRMRVLTGEQEIHVDADIAWAVDAYLRASDDERILDDGAAGMVAETARFFASRGEETSRGYEIDHVIGPDELHEDVRNSAFTNVLGAWTMRMAADLAEAGRTPAPASEIARWRELAERMVVLHDAQGRIEQHEGFLELPLPEERAAQGQGLAFEGDRMQWRDVKQADVVMLMAVLEPLFDELERRANYLLYEPLTRHLSSLSEAVHSLVARRVGLAGQADDYLTRAIAIDLHDSRGNRPEGIHMATQGGLWQAVVCGCGGVRAERAALRLDPRLPEGWQQLRFRVQHAGAPLTVSMSRDLLRVDAASGRTRVSVNGFEGEVAAGRPLRLTRAGEGWRLDATSG